MTELMMVGLSQGLVLSLIAYGLVIPFKLLNCADLTAEGAYPLGGAVAATLIILNFPVALALLAALVAGGVCGIATGIIQQRLRMNGLLAGIILSTMLYSINLRLLAKPNLSLFNKANLFSNNLLHNIILLILIVTSLLLPLMMLLKTHFGLRLRAVGLNMKFAHSQGISITLYSLSGLFLGNAFSGLAGGLMVELQRYMDINMGVGIVIHALAALMLGETLIAPITINRQLLAPLIGALVYQQIQGMIIFLGLPPSDLKFFTGSVVLAIVILKGKAL